MVAEFDASELQVDRLSRDVCAFSPDEKLIAVLESRGLVLYSPGNNKRLGKMACPRDDGIQSSVAVCCAFSDRDHIRVITLDRADRLRCIQIDTGLTTDPKKVFEHECKNIQQVAISRDGRFLAAQSGVGEESKPGTIKCWNIDEGKQLVSVAGSIATCSALHVSLDGGLVTCGSTDGEIVFVDVLAARSIPLANKSRFRVTCIDAGRKLVVYSTFDRLGEYNVRVLSRESKEMVGGFVAGKSGIYGVHFSGDESQLLVAEAQGPVSLWKVADIIGDGHK
jgi:WD40 repeat protein